MRYFYPCLLTALSLLATGCENMKGHYEYELSKARDRDEMHMETIRQLREENYELRSQLFELQKDDHVMILGELNDPGIYYLDRAATIVEVIEMAGGETRLTSRNAFIKRDGERYDIDIDAPQSASITIMPGDVVYFSRLML